MHINRKYAYPIVTAATIIGVCIRASIFPELGWNFHLLSLGFSFVFAPLLLEGAVSIHNYFNRIFPYDIRLFVSDHRVAKRIVLQVATGVVIYACIGAFGIWAYKDMIPPSLAMPMLAKPFIVVGFVTLFLFVLAVNLGVFGKEFFDRWKEELLNSERLRKERAEAQFENLKNQFNPHFLFNALTSLNSLISENPRLASEFVQQLAKVYRYVLQSREKEYVPLATEMSFVQHYIKLLQTRFQTMVQVVVDVAPEARERLIVPVTLQALIENAIKHNIINAQNPLCIKISSTMENDAWYLVVENTLQRKQLVEGSNKQGLQNLQTLYSYITPLALDIRADEAAMTFTVRLPLL
jgi:sensor histidine kinase YesM